MSGSEVSKFREEQALQEQAAQQGLHGFAAGYSRHDFIEARMSREADTLTYLMKNGTVEEVERTIERMQQDIRQDIQRSERLEECRTMTNKNNRN